VVRRRSVGRSFVKRGVKRGVCRVQSTVSTHLPYSVQRLVQRHLPSEEESPSSFETDRPPCDGGDSIWEVGQIEGTLTVRERQIPRPENTRWAKRIFRKPTRATGLLEVESGWEHSAKEYKSFILSAAK
jgi:hypothetical protein